MSRPMNILVLQGGGALGAYQVGVFEALQERGITIDWVVGTSVGAINGALIAGGAPDRSLERLDTFWRRVAQPHGHLGAPFEHLESSAARYLALSKGVPGFFKPRPFWNIPLFTPTGSPVGFYDTTPLEATLNELIEFDRLGTRDIADGTRLSVGAVSVTRGDITYFDSHHHAMGARHIMASGALPPGFPPVEVDGELYWDGGLFSNTPLNYVLEEEQPGQESAVNCYVIDLWNAEGPAPQTIMDAMNREKDIQYSTRAGEDFHFLREIHRLKNAIRTLGHHLPEDVRRSSQLSQLIALGHQHPINLVRLLAPSRERETAQKDIDFSWSTIMARRRAGYDDMRQALVTCPTQRDPISDEIGANVCSFRSGLDGQLTREL
ncbi:patatin-like phospholipase family protein [Larsenimonas suaedae]|uniref:Patatin-like phospholipase family protein n=1 Tax=Larsenimonas suaedae TaxID=1851019 RepID=A0ABU1GYE7_9GAMM|nr:patatin-like phospholipase family protein [Larsenimonas suaedae]MCM2973562.1 patatin-like phospholipase family protein [Larsenimonas suaedae]MDR5897068.1 patatin-like phospholipase family protein [Larsenimonas suaedae]